MVLTIAFGVAVGLSIANGETPVLAYVLANVSAGLAIGGVVAAGGGDGVRARERERSGVRGAIGARISEHVVFTEGRANASSRLP